MKQYDAIIIGFGKAGKVLAAELSNRGWKVAIVERSKTMYGGSCPNIACIPTKALIHEADISSLFLHEDYPKQANMYKQAIYRKNKLTSFLRESNYEKLSKRPNVTIYTGVGSFTSTNTIKVTLPDGDIELQGKEIFINTGSTPIIPAIDGIKQSQKVYTSATMLEVDLLPKHLIIVGGGYIGLEFASMYAGFGSKVTVLEGGNKFMPNEDRDIANSVKDVMKRKGIEIRLNSRAQSIHDTNDGVTLTYSDVSDGTPYFIDGDAILIAVFIDPPLAHIGLTEEEALKRGYSIKVSRLPATAVVRSRTLQQIDGMLKAIVNNHSGKIMGCTLFCADASEVINIVAMAMKTGQHYTFLRDFIFTHPSMSEGLNELFDV